MTTRVQTQLPLEVRKKVMGKRVALALLCFAKHCVVLLRWDCLVLIVQSGIDSKAEAEKLTSGAMAWLLVLQTQWHCVVSG